MRNHPAAVVAAIFGLISTLALGCGSGSPGQGQTGSTELLPQYGGKQKRVAGPNGFVISTLNPYETGNSTSLSTWTLEGLVRYETLGYLDRPDAAGRAGQFQHQKVVPALAERTLKPTLL